MVLKKASSDSCPPTARTGSIPLTQKTFGLQAPLIDREQLEIPLLLSCKDGKLEEVKKLIISGADVNTRDVYGWTPLMFAARNNHIKIAAYLIRKKANLDLQNKNNHSALMLACASGHEQMSFLLLRKGANPYLVDSNGETALDLSRRFGNTPLTIELAETQNDNLGNDLPEIENPPKTIKI